MKRGTRFLIGLAAAVITYASLTAFVGPRYYAGWQYDNYYRGYHHRWYPYRPYWQRPPYAPPDSFYLHPPTPQRNY